MTKSKFNRLVQEVGGRLPCWREDTYEINRKSQEREEMDVGESDISSVTRGPHLEAPELAEPISYDPNWARKKKTSNGMSNMKIVEDKMFPRKRRSELIQYH